LAYRACGKFAIARSIESERYDTANLQVVVSMLVVLISGVSEKSAVRPHFFFVRDFQSIKIWST
jgi:hypothetical protein